MVSRDGRPVAGGLAGSLLLARCEPSTSLEAAQGGPRLSAYLQPSLLPTVRGPWLCHPLCLGPPSRRCCGRAPRAPCLVIPKQAVAGGACSRGGQGWSGGRPRKRCHGGVLLGTMGVKALSDLGTRASWFGCSEAASVVGAHGPSQVEAFRCGGFEWPWGAGCSAGCW